MVLPLVERVLVESLFCRPRCAEVAEDFVIGRLRLVERKRHTLGARRPSTDGKCSTTEHPETQNGLKRLPGKGSTRTGS